MTYSDSNSIVSAQNLSINYANRTIWTNASFRIKKGQFVALLGPNGAGKTTLIRLILGLMQPSTGTLKVFDSDPKRGNPLISYIPQRHVIERDLKIEALEFVRLGISANKWGVSSITTLKKEHRVALQMLTEVGAKELAHYPVGLLSGGELQRIFLAQALVSSPELLLLDEPLANLDIRRQLELIRLIDTLVRKHGVTALLIAHDVNPLLPVLDEVIYIANGHVATGLPTEVINSRTLSKLYGVPIEVLRDTRGRLAVLGTEEVAHHDD